MKRAAVALLVIGAAPFPTGDVAAIRAARARSNAAIAARDPIALRAEYVDDYSVIGGTGGKVGRGADDVVRDFAAANFKQPSFAGYVRTPDRIVVARPAARAMERGHWIGRWHNPEARRAGEYLAVWVPVGSTWKLRSESFVTLSESGDVPR